MGARGYTMNGGIQDWGGTAYTFGQTYDTLSRTVWAQDYIMGRAVGIVGWWRWEAKAARE